ncbi:MAG: HNH endonuclease signature motif containing protein [Pseudomonadota bacterium]|nr:HNH endonuclease signature motif containing protein [Pseudomonadota bacterium]
MSRRIWTEIELQVLRAAYPDSLTADIARAMGRPVGQVYQQAARLGLSKTAAFYASAQAHRLDGLKGAGTRFVKGHKTWNSGMKGLQIGGKATQFKPGHRGGRAEQVYQPIGAERVSKEGYLERKVNDDMPFYRRWQAVHRIEWIARHGPIPPGHVVVFRSADRHDFSDANLDLITRAELTRRNSIHRYPREVRDLIRLNARLKRTLDDHANQ